MPELPEVETVVRDLREKITGRTIVGLSVYCPAVARTPSDEFCRFLTGARIEAVARRGKYIIVSLDGERSLLVHLGMTGRLLALPTETSMEKHTHVVFNLDNGQDLRYQDTRRFGFLAPMETGEVSRYMRQKRMGKEPLSIEKDELAQLLATSRARLKGLLLDQRIMAGIGNIYADEILHNAGIHPTRAANSLTGEEIARLSESIGSVLREAIAKKGSSVSDYVDVSGNRGSYQDSHRVYRRTGRPCYTCGAPIERSVVAGRSSHYCGVCQPRKNGA